MNGTEQRGFTLVEVVVALAITAIGMLAVFKTIGDTTHNVTDLRDRTFATWIADNRITEIRISGEMPSVDETAGDVEFAARRWHWVAKVSQTEVQGLRRIDVTVRRDEDPEGVSLATLAGFVGATATASPAGAVNWQGPGGPGGPGDEDGEDAGGSDDEGDDGDFDEDEDDGGDFGDDDEDDEFVDEGDAE